MSRICEGWTVLELGSGSVAASLAGMMLADNGARVVKVEPPVGRPPAHGVTVRLRSCGTAARRASSPTWAPMPAGPRREKRRSVPTSCSPACRRQARAVGSRRGGSPRPTTLRWSTARSQGSARPGDYARLRAYEGVVAAKSGVFARGDFGFRPGPIFYDAPWASLGAAHEAVAGVLAALIVREQTGRGQHLDATLVSGISALDYFGTMHWQHAQRTGREALVTISPSAPTMAATRTMLWLATKDSRFITTTAMLPHRGAAARPRRRPGAHARRAPLCQRSDVLDPEDAQDFEDLMWAAFRTRRRSTSGSPSSGPTPTSPSRPP